MKNRLKTAVLGLRRQILSTLGLETAQAARANYKYDRDRFLAHSSSRDARVSTQAFRHRLTKEYHRIEKGLALPDPRPGFGQETLERVRAMVEELESAGQGGLETAGARGALRTYATWHRDRDAAIPDWLETFLARDDPALPGGTRPVTRAEIAAATDCDFDRFARARHSVRQFTGAPVDPAEIKAAMATALKTPRVCNRESRRIHVAYDAETRARMLSHQNGNRGFGHMAGAVLVVTSDLRAFTDLGERNQAWVDGGLFAMSLAYALHGRGLGTCMLNWSAPWWRDRDMRADIGIPDNEAVITMVAVGHLPETMVVAASPAPDAASRIRTVS